MKRDRIDATGAAVLVAFSMALGLNQVLVKLVNVGMEPTFQAGLRSALASVVVVIIALALRKRLSVTDGSLLAGIMAGVIFGLEFLLLFQGIDKTTVVRASVLFYTMPAWLAVMAHFLLGERMTPVRGLGLVLAVLGVAVAILPGGAVAGSSTLAGDMMCLAASVFWAAIAIMTRTTKLARSSPYMQLIYQLVVSAPILILAAAIPGEFITGMTPGLWGIFAFQVVGVVGVGFVAWFWVLSVYPAGAMASFAFLAPVFGVFFGWLILGEPLGWTIVLALVLVGIGIVLVNRK